MSNPEDPSREKSKHIYDNLHIMLKDNYGNEKYIVQLIQLFIDNFKH